MKRIIVAHNEINNRADLRTYKNYTKCQQIKQNPNVAISVAGYDFEGEATLLGHPLDAENSQFANMNHLTNYYN